MECMNEDSAEDKRGNALLIELIKQFPVLYNKQLKEYKNQTIRANAWTTISKLMEMPRNYYYPSN